MDEREHGRHREDRARHDERTRAPSRDEVRDRERRARDVRADREPGEEGDVPGDDLRGIDGASEEHLAGAENGVGERDGEDGDEEGDADSRPSVVVAIVGRHHASTRQKPIFRITKRGSERMTIITSAQMPGV